MSGRKPGARPVLIFAGFLLVGILVAALVILQGRGAAPAKWTAPQKRTAGREMSPVGAAGWWEVMFTDPLGLPAPDDPATQVPAGSIEERLIARIGMAERSIHLACFEFNLTPIAAALVAAGKRGVEVRWVTDDEHGLDSDAEKGRGQFALLRAAGIEVKSDTRSALMHDKFIVIDGTVVWTGATNLTVAGMFENDNNVIAIESPELAAIYEREFEEMWAGQFNAKSPSDRAAQSVTIGATRIDALFSPEDGAMSRIVPIVAGAKESIRIMAFSFTHEDLGAALLERHGAGIDTAVIFETRGSETKYSELPLLHNAGVPVRQDGNPSTFHHKVIVVDGRVTITGSLNFSANADESNNENTLIIDDPEIASLYLREFDRCWALGREPDPAKFAAR